MYRSFSVIYFVFHIALYLLGSLFSFGLDVSVIAVVNDDIVTSVDVENFSKILCSQKLGSKKMFIECCNKEKMHAIQTIIGTKIQDSYFKKMEDKIRDINFNNSDFTSFLHQNEIRFKFNKNIAILNKIDYDLFLEYVKNQFLFLMLVNSYARSKSTNKDIENNDKTMKIAEDLMQKLRSQAFVELR